MCIAVNTVACQNIPYIWSMKRCSNRSNHRLRKPVRNISFMLVTLLVHALVAIEQVRVLEHALLTLLTSHVLMSPLNPSAFQNISFMLVTLLTSQLPRSPLNPHCEHAIHARHFGCIPAVQIPREGIGVVEHVVHENHVLLPALMSALNPV